MGRIDRLFDGSNAHLLDEEATPASQSELIEALGGDVADYYRQCATCGVFVRRQRWIRKDNSYGYRGTLCRKCEE